MRITGVKPPEPGRSLRVSVEGSAVAVFNIAGQLFAVGAKCPHAGGPLEQGAVSGTEVTCPYHGSRFDVRTGAVLRGPAMKPVPAYRVRTEGDGLEIEPI